MFSGNNDLLKLLAKIKNLKMESMLIVNNNKLNFRCQKDYQIVIICFTSLIFKWITKKLFISIKIIFMPMLKIWQN